MLYAHAVSMYSSWHKWQVYVRNIWLHLVFEVVLLGQAVPDWSLFEVVWSIFTRFEVIRGDMGRRRQFAAARRVSRRSGAFSDRSPQNSAECFETYYYVSVLLIHAFEVEKLENVRVCLCVCAGVPVEYRSNDYYYHYHRVFEWFCAWRNDVIVFGPASRCLHVPFNN